MNDGDAFVGGIFATVFVIASLCLSYHVGKSVSKGEVEAKAVEVGVAEVRYDEKDGTKTFVWKRPASK